jgi:hypothetical protein
MDAEGSTLGVEVLTKGSGTLSGVDQDVDSVIRLHKVARNGSVIGENGP